MKRNKPGPPPSHRSARQSRKRLQRVIALIFAGLALPVYLLLDKVYTQLENETFYAYRDQAEDLAARIQERFQEIFAPENRRPFAQYSFFNVQDNPLLQSKGVNLSPLSKLPPDSSVPGVVGYFQINPDGSFHSPVLPNIDGNESDKDIASLSQTELERRKKQRESLLNLLAVSPAAKAKVEELRDPGRKDLGSKFRDSPERKRPDPKRRDAQARFEQMFDAESAGRGAVLATDKDNPLTKAKSAPLIVGQTRSNQKPLDSSTLGKLNIDARLWAGKTRPSVKDTKNHNEKTDRYGFGFGSRRKERVEIPDQAAAGDYFKSLSEQEASSSESTASRSDSDYADPYASTQTEEKESAKKQNEARVSAASTNRPIRILSFDSEIDSLSMLVLDNAHICFYRRVWRDNGRYIQGFIARRQALLTEIVRPLLRNSPMEKFSRLLIAYRGNILEQIDASNNAYASELSTSNRQPNEPEGLIYRTFLGAPVDEVELLFSASKLPESPGTPVINIAAASFLAVLSLGFFALYRIGIRQIELAQQHRNFVSAISHELKTPLTSIRMYGDMLRSGWVADDVKAKSYYDYIVSESERLSRLIANVLQLTKLDNHSGEPRLKSYSLAALLIMIEEKTRAQCDAAGCKFNTIELDADIQDCEIETDEDAFLQIFINLIDNALKFSADTEPKQIDIGVETESGRGKRATFFVRDYGPGIEPAQMKKIFQLFYRAGDELTRTKPGTGIGLTLVKQLAALLNARVDLTNRQPGAQFMVSFPLLDENIQ